MNAFALRHWSLRCANKKRQEKRQGQEQEKGAQHLNRIDIHKEINMEQIFKVNVNQNIENNEVHTRRKEKARHGAQKGPKSQAQKTRTKEWKKRKRLTHVSVHTNQSGVHGELDACFRKPKFSTLSGDVIREPPPYLRYLFGLGGKYVPFPHPRGFVKKQITKVNDRFAELRRVIVWDAFHKFCETDCESKRPPFPLFPYKRFFVSRGTNPNGDIEKKWGSKLFKIDHSIKVVADQTKRCA